MYRHITVPLDGTSESLEALDLAVHIAQQAGCPVELVRIAFPTGYDSELYDVAVRSAEVGMLRRDAAESLQVTADQVEARGVRTSTAVLEGPIPSMLADHVGSTGADLVVMTTHDRNRLERLLLGSVSEAVVRHVHVPVLLVHADQGAAALLEAGRRKHILISLDGSLFGDQVIPHAARLASLLHADITLLTVVDANRATASLATETGMVPGISPPRMADVEGGDSSELVRRELEETAQSLRGEGITVHAVVIDDGNPSRAIAEYVRKHAIDLIAMTTHGRGALGRLVAGSVSTAVLHATRTPILLFRPAM